MVTYTYTDVSYGPGSQQKCDIWAGTNASGNPQACILYFPGGGWNRTDKSLAELLFHFFSSALGSANQQAVQGLYERDDDIVFCAMDYPIAQSNSETGIGTDTPAWKRAPSHSTFMQGGIRAVHDAVRFFRTYGPSLYNIDPDKIIIAGSSAGGHNVAAAAYQSGEGYSTSLDVGFTHAELNTVSNVPDAVILHQTPMDISLTPGGLYNAFTGFEDGNFQTDLDLLERVKRCAGLRLVDFSPNKIPVFSWYDTEYIPSFNPADDLDNLNGAHSPYWGVAHHTKLASRSTPNHQLVVFAEDSGGDLAAATGSWASLFNPDALANNLGSTAAWPTVQLRTWLQAINMLPAD